MRITPNLYQCQNLNKFAPNNILSSNNIDFRASHKLAKTTQNIKCLQNKLAVNTDSSQKFLKNVKAKLLAILASSPLLIFSTALFNLKGFFAGPQEPLTLEKEICFKKANTIDEAANFAKENFKIKNYYSNDLNIANWVNEALCNINNTFAGKVYMPKNLIITDSSLYRNDAGYYQSSFDTLVINSDAVKRGVKHIENPNSKLISTIKFLLAHPIGTQYERFEAIITKYFKNPNALSKMEKYQLHRAIWTQADVITENKGHRVLDIILNSRSVPQKDYFGPVNYDKFGLIYHEMGHVFMAKASKINIDDITKFNNAKQDFPFRAYIKTNEKEFCADIFSGLMNGDIYPQKYLDLYEKLTNIKFPSKK